MTLLSSNKRELVGYIVAAVVWIVEFLVLFHNRAFHPPPSLLPINVQRELTFNAMNGGAWTGIIGTMISFPISFISSYFEGFSGFASFLYSFINFSVLFLGIFFSSKYYLKKYFKASGGLLYISSILSAILVPITYYTFSGVIYYFPGVMAIALILFDYALDVKKISLKEALKRGAIAAIGATFGFTDPRGIFFTLFAFLLYSLYFIVLKRRLSYILTWLKIILFGAISFIILNINTIIYAKLISPFISLVSVSTIYNQMGIALQHVNPFYTLTGVMYWLGPAYYLSTFHPISIIFGAVGAAIALSALLYRKPIVIFLSIFVLFVVAYNFVGSPTIGYWMAQTPYVGYLVYLYPTYLPSYLFVAPFYLLFSFTLYGVGRKIYGNLHNHLKFVAAALLLIVMASSLFVFYLPVAQSFMKETTVYPPSGIKGGVNLVSGNDSGIVLVLGNTTLASFYLYPFITNPAFYGYMNFIWYAISNSYNAARALSLLGVQYVVFLDYRNSQFYKVISNNQNFKLVYNTSNTQIFYNTLYSPYIINRGIYVAFNFPQAILNLSKINSSYVIVPFYYVNNLTDILPYVKGFIGYNVNANDLIPMLVNNSSYVISASNIYANQYYTGGWMHQSPFWTPDALNAITSGNPNLPLNLSLNIPDGKYYVYVLPVFTTLSGLTRHSGWIKISSSNEVDVDIDSSVYNVSWVNMGELYIKNHDIHIYVSNVNIVRIVLVPSKVYPILSDEAASILQERSLISFTNNSTVIKTGTYQPKGYGISVFSNPWMVQFTYAHSVRVPKSIYEFNYYFGVASVHVISSYPKIDTEQVSDLPYISLNFILDLLIVIYILYSTGSFTYLTRLKRNNNANLLQFHH